jgi:hypothetical protein
MTNLLGALLGVLVPLASPVPDQGREPPQNTANTVNAHGDDQRGQQPEGRRKSSRKHRKHKAPARRRTP